MPRILKKAPLETGFLAEVAAKLTNRISTTWWRWFEDVYNLVKQIFPAVNDTRTVWDDARAPATSVKAPGVQDPDWDSDNVGWRFDKTLDERIDAIFQLSHAYQANTNVQPHIHWEPTTTGGGNVVWSISYAWTNSIGVVVPDAANWTQVDSNGVAPGVTRQTVITGFGNVVPTHAQAESSIIKVKLSRLGGHAGDNYDADALLDEIDIHYQLEKLGSSAAIPS